MAERADTYKTETDPRRCPLCGGDNRCAAAAGGDPRACWCWSVSISPTALAAVPEADVGRRCICPICAGAAKEKAIEG